jgi:isoquinoline 1-oxidoreductase alpha subunit
MADISISINGKPYTVTVEDTRMPLLWMLRDLLGMTGTKFGCGVGLCGACTVHLNGVSVRSCQTPAAMLCSAHGSLKKYPNVDIVNRGN